MAGLLDFEDPRTMGLLNAGLGIMAQAGDTSRQFGLGQALASGLGTMQQTQLQAEMLKRQKAQEDLAMQMHQMQFGQMQQQIKDQEAMKQAMIDYAKSKQRTPVSSQAQPFKFSMDAPISDYQLSAVPSNSAPMQSNQPQSTSAPTIQTQSKPNATQSRIDELNNQADFLESKGISGDGLRAKAIELTKLLPKYSNDYKIGYDKSGNLVNVRTADDGSEIYSPTSVAEEYHFSDNGQQLLKTGKYSGKTGVVSGKYQTPDSIATNATTQRGQNMTDARARETNAINRLGQQTQVINDPNQGILLVDKGTGLTRKTYDQNGAPIPSESQTKKITAANNIIPILDEASKLIDGATGSYVGTGVDMGARALGLSTEGAQNTAKLKVLEGALMMNQPRMEGPQSDKDVALYRQMAGQIGDPTVPSDIKKAALAQIRAMHQKYATGGGAVQSVQGAPSTGGWSIQKVN